MAVTALWTKVLADFVSAGDGDAQEYCFHLGGVVMEPRTPSDPLDLILWAKT